LVCCLIGGREVRVNATMDWMPTVLARHRAIEQEPLPRNIDALLTERAIANPGSVAWHFIATGDTVTYAQLREQVSRCASGLRSLGVYAGCKVAVMLPNVPAFPLSWLALARIGAVMVPVNVRYTGRELHYAVTDSEAEIVVLDAAFLPVLADARLELPASHVVVVGDAPAGFTPWHSLLSEAVDTDTASHVGIDDLMNIQYTSGTTGLPKGCLLSQRYWLTCAKVYSSADGMHFRRIFAANPFFYMTPQWLLLMAFYQGATLFVAPHISLTHYAEWLRTYRIDYCWFPMDAHISIAPTPNDRDNAIVRANLSIHRKELHAAVEQRFGFPLRAAFGMTEIGAGLYTPLVASEMTGSGSCGMPTPFREARIADLNGNTLPVGQEGELLFRGPGLLQGYWRKPEATEAAFHGDWFRSGDLARQDERGFVTIVGRIKEMIRRAGENISATEVENVLLMLPGIAEAAAVPVPDAQRGEEVKAYLVLSSGVTQSDMPPERVIEHCRTQLASFKVPRYLEYRAVLLPRSTSGKVQKPALLAETDDLRRNSWDRLAGA
jgi:acyl-CoA synthetase (AMP-forming)/AMP-acid ligase II